ncbi:MAG TPA: hypothetical protein O0X66_05155, partial [Methanocorpusculum sp.]|nr:hypothetical protein [Methanocorpusculum sp.]HJJ53869.1 hypothetical protein [Methanocorpusculum sp.]
TPIISHTQIGRKQRILKSTTNIHQTKSLKTDTKHTKMESKHLFASGELEIFTPQTLFFYREKMS